MLERGLIPEEMIKDKETFRAAQNDVVYNMFHLMGGMFEVTELHLATHFQGEAKYAGTDVYKTTGSHFKGKNFDIKYVRSGYGLQVVAYETKEGKWVVKLIQLYPGAVAVSLPGTIDVIVNLGGLNFSDRSFDVNDAMAEKISKRLNLSDRFKKALMKNDNKFAEGLPAKGMPVVIFEEEGKLIVKIHPAFVKADLKEKVKVEIIKSFSPYFVHDKKAVMLNEIAEKIYNPPFDYVGTYKKLVEEKLLLSVLEGLTFGNNLIDVTEAEDIGTGKHLPYHSLHKALTDGMPARLLPHTEGKPWGSGTRRIGEYLFSSIEQGRESAVAPVGAEPFAFGKAIAQNPVETLGREVVNAYGTKPILLKYLTPGSIPRVSDLSRQVHDTKNELWVVVKTTVDKPQIILGFSHDRIDEFVNREKFLEAYEKALVKYTETLNAVNAAFKELGAAKKALKGIGNTINFIPLTSWRQIFNCFHF